jgi:NTE family protein
MSRPKLGLILSGGGARGLAHIGVLKIFSQADLQIDCLSGASLGGIIAAAYASGMPISELEEQALKFSQIREMMKLVDINPGHRGLLEGARVKAFLSQWFDESCTFESLQKPLALNTVDLNTAREIVFTSGPLLPAVLATIAVPGLFTPIEIGPYRLVDGGFLKNLPCVPARQLGAEVLIAVDIQMDPHVDPPWQDLPARPNLPGFLPNFFLDFYRAELVMVAELTKSQIELAKPEIVIKPSIPPDITMFLGFSKPAEIIAAGELAATEALPAIRKLMETY